MIPIQVDSIVRELMDILSKKQITPDKAVIVSTDLLAWVLADFRKQRNPDIIIEDLVDTIADTLKTHPSWRTIT